MKLKNQKGITLIALAITIIVLIILALITIDATIGENGLFKKAEQARDYMKNGVASDEQMLDDVLNQIESATATKWINTFSVYSNKIRPGYIINTNEDGKIYIYDSNAYMPQWNNLDDIELFSVNRDLSKVSIKKGDDIYIYNWDSYEYETLEQEKIGLENENIIYITEQPDSYHNEYIIFTKEGNVYKMTKLDQKVELLDIGINNDEIIDICPVMIDYEEEIIITTKNGELYNYQIQQTTEENILTNIKEEYTELAGEKIIDIQILNEYGEILVLTDTQKVFYLNIELGEIEEESFVNKIDGKVDKVFYAPWGVSINTEDGKTYTENDGQLMCISEYPMFKDKKIEEIFNFFNFVLIRLNDGKFYNFNDSGELQEIPNLKDINYKYIKTENSIYYYSEYGLIQIVTNTYMSKIPVNRKVSNIIGGYYENILGLDEDGKVFFITEDFNNIEYMDIEEKIIDINYINSDFICISENGNIYTIDDYDKEINKLPENTLNGEKAIKVFVERGNYIIIDNEGKAHCYNSDWIQDDESMNLENVLKDVEINQIESGLLLDNSGILYNIDYDYNTKEYSLSNYSDTELNLSGKKIVKIKDGLILDDNGKIYGYSNTDINDKKIVDMSTNYTTTVFIDEDGKKYDYGSLYYYIPN